MKEPRRSSAPARPASSPPTVVVRAKGYHATASMFAVALFMAAGLGGVWWVFDQRGQGSPPKSARKPAAAVASGEAQAPAAAETVAPATTPAAPEKVEPSLAVAPQVTPAPATPDAEEPAAPPTEAGLFGTRLAGEPVLALIGIDATKNDEVARAKTLLAETARLGTWNDYRDFLKRSLSESLGKVDPVKLRERFDPLWKEPVFYQVFLRWHVLQRFSGSDIATRTYGHELFSWLMTNDTAMEEVLLTLKPQDDTSKVAALLSDAWGANREQAEKYFNLALACAVVFDTGEIQIQSKDADHYGAAAMVAPIPRYTWYIGKSEKGKLATSIHKLSARDLVWVVCAPVPESELEWAIDKMQLSRKSWGNAYGMIEYLMERAVNGLDPYEEYTFAEILKEGGICGDQTYFCVNTARALGIPAIALSGETDLGGHAWAAVKTKDDEWDTHIGRIGGAANGAGGQAQIGGQISEQEIWLWNDKAQQSRLQTVNVFRYLWLGDLMENLYEPTSAESAVRVANQLGKAFSETWLRLHEVLATKTSEAKDPGAPEILEAWDEFVDNMRREFRENPRMAQLAAKAESEYLFPYAKEGDARRMLLRERRRIEREAGEQKDLVADSLKREADLIHKNNAPGAAKEISQLYDKSLRQYGGSITGFKRMAEDYFSFCKDDPETARKAARDIELAFLRVVETGSKDWFRANTETSIYKMICGYYRTAGDEAKAVKLERRYERLLRAAERGAL